MVVELRKNQIKYHKVVTEEQARRLFDEALEDYVTQIVMPNGKVWKLKEDGSLELTNFIHKI